MSRLVNHTLIIPFSSSPLSESDVSSSFEAIGGEWNQTAARDSELCDNVLGLGAACGTTRYTSNATYESSASVLLEFSGAY